MSVKFENRVVAFVDILGFKSEIHKAENDVEYLKEFSKLIELLESSVDALDSGVRHKVPAELIPKHIVISDSIVLSAPFSVEEHPWYDGLSIIAMRCIQLTHIFLSKGYLIRGGIAIGKTCHTDNNIYGSAFQEAYNFEKKLTPPCIALTKSAQVPEILAKYSNTFIDEGDHVRVNGLHDWYIDTKYVHGGIEDTYEDYQKTVDIYCAPEQDDEIRVKWLKFNEYLQKARKDAEGYIKADG